MLKKIEENAYSEKQKKLYNQAVFNYRTELAFGLSCIAWAGYLIETKEVLPFNDWVNRLFLLLLLIVLMGKHLMNYQEALPILNFDPLNQLRKFASTGDLEQVRNIIAEVGFEGMNSVTKDTLRNCLHFAVANRQLIVIRYLRDVGADINAQDCLGNTPVHYAVQLAVQQKCYEVLLELLQYENTTKNKERRLLVASKSSQLDSPQIVNQIGFFAKYKLPPEFPKINFDIDPTLKNKDGWTILGLLELCKDKSTEQYRQAHDEIVLLNQVRHRFNQ